MRLVAAGLLRSVSQTSARSRTAIRATRVALPQGPSLRFGLYCPDPSSLTRPHPPHSRTRCAFPTLSVIHNATAVRERLGSPEWFRAFAHCSFLSCRLQRPRGLHGRLTSSLPHCDTGLRRETNGSAVPTPSQSASREGGISRLSVRSRYDLTVCSPTLTDQTRYTPSLSRLLLPGFQQIGHPLCCWISLRQQLESSADGTFTHWNSS